MQKLVRAGVRQQQRRHLRARLPFADRLRPEDHARRVGRHAGLRLGREGRRDHGHRRQPDRRPPGVRVAHEAPPARGREADRRRSAPDRPGALAARRGRRTTCSCARHQRRGHQRARARDRHRRPGRRGLHRRALRRRRLRAVARVRRSTRELAGGTVEAITGVPAELVRGAARLYAPRPQRRDLLRPRRHRAQPGLDHGDGHRQPRDGHRQRRPRGRRRESAARPEQRAGLVRHGLVPARAAGLPPRARTPPCAASSRTTWGVHARAASRACASRTCSTPRIDGSFKGLYVPGRGHRAVRSRTRSTSRRRSTRWSASSCRTSS